jgi:23S rRNA (uridine2552-2'-O)-methyltransferase
MSRKPGSYVEKGNARYDRHDHYFRKAREEGFAARSIYKLDELDREFRILRRGDVVVDLGCAPGSWMQYVERKVLPGGRAYGIDLLPAKVSFGPHVRILQGDAFAVTLEALTGTAHGQSLPSVDVVLSDMAPNTTGIRAVDQARSMALCERALEVAARLLRPGGNFVVKVLEGGEMKAFVDSCRTVFESVKIKRPKSTRDGSTETFVVGLARKRVARAAAAPAPAPAPPAPAADAAAPSVAVPAPVSGPSSTPAPEAVSSKAVSSKAVSSKAVSSKAVSSKAVSSKAVSSKAVSSKAVSSKAVSSKAGAPKAGSPKAGSPKAGSSKPATKRATKAHKPKR